VAGIVTFGLFYLLCAAVFYAIFGWPATLFYALSLPVASLAAYYYTRELKRFAASVRASWVRLRAPLATRNLLALRAELIAEIEAEQRAIGRQLAPEKRTA
jgi:hypothetical protein